MLQTLGAGTRPRTQLEGQGWAGVALLHWGRFRVEATRTVALPQSSSLHSELVPSEPAPHSPTFYFLHTSFLLAMFTGACCSSHYVTVTGHQCNTTGRFSVSVIFPLNTSKGPEKYLINLFDPLEKKEKKQPQNKTNNKLQGSSGK